MLEYNNKEWKVAGYEYPAHCTIPANAIQQSDSPNPFVFRRSSLIFEESEDYLSPEQLKKIEQGISDVKKGNTISSLDVKRIFGIE